MKVRKKS